ncbi:MAG: hypothetical protein K5686_06060 [Lachnospiraceae bacterium]|nr:hypothetical protein [Lachnospiraceae bacterium]
MEGKNSSPWKELYEKIGGDVPENEAEREIHKMLSEGKGVIDCAEYAKSRGMTDAGFLDLMKRADSREEEEIRNENKKA